jgi:hypothetical protein
MYTYTSDKGWFLTAGYRFKWQEDGYDIRGIGFNKGQLIGKGDEIVVIVDNQKYSLNTKEAIDFIHKYDAYFKAGKGSKQTTLGVVSKSLMTMIK